MKNIIVDLEMNPLSKEFKEERKICGMEVIEIGAIVLDESYQEIGSFKTLVKPQYNTRIERKYEKLTGISTKMVENAPIFQDALQMLLSWCRSYSDLDHIYQWSESDLAQIKKEIALKHISIEGDEDLLTSWEDFQNEIVHALNMGRAVSLRDALMYAGVDAEGTFHDALFDARNTGSLLRVLRTPILFERSLAHVAEVMQPEACTLNLGSLFDGLNFITS